MIFVWSALCPSGFDTAHLLPAEMMVCLMDAAQVQ
jgi:hypothetical protein